MNELLNERATGRLGQNAFARHVSTDLLHAFRPAPRLRFDGGELGTNIDDDESGGGSSSNGRHCRDIWAHQAGVNALALERFDGRIMISGGSDATIRIWDLEQANFADPSSHTFRPVAEIARAGAVGGPNTRGPFRPQHQQQQATHMQSSHTPVSKGQGHRFGVTHLSFYPFDNAAFLSSSFDQTLKLWATDSARLSGSFDLGSKVYSHAVSPVADHLLVACATQHPAVRLVDLRSGAAVQSLVAAGQVAGGVLSVAWSPRHEHILASGAVDGTVRIWDVRRASGLIALLDQEDSLGQAGPGSQARPARASARAHAGPVNGLAWADDGAYLVSAGHDRRIRVWDMATGANTLVSFGPSVRNSGLSSVPMVVTPTGLTAPRQELLVWPNESEVLVFRLHDGSIVTRLRGMGATQAGVRLPEAPTPPPLSYTQSSSASISSRPRPAVAPTPADRSSARRNRVTSLVWRGAGGMGSEKGGTAMGGRDAVGGLYSGHLDGQIRAWTPSAKSTNVDEDFVEDGADATPQAVEERDRKRRALDQAYRSLMGTQITFR